MPRTSASVVICCFDPARRELLYRAIQEARSNLGEGDELVVVVDHSPELLELVAAWLSELADSRLRVLENIENRGLSGARNTGAAVADGDVVVFLDDDAVPRGHWLDELLATFADVDVAAVGGHVEAAWAAGRPDWFPPAFDWVVGCSYQGQHLGDVRNPIGANMAVRRSALEAVGGFRHGLGRVGATPLGCEETELGLRLASQGAGRCVVISGALVEHHVPASRGRWSYFVRRCWSEGISKAIVADWASEGAVTRSDSLATERGHTRATDGGIGFVSDESDQVDGSWCAFAGGSHSSWYGSNDGGIRSWIPGNREHLMTIDMTTAFTDLAGMRYDAHVISWTQTLRHHGIDHLVLKGVGFTDWLGRTRIPRDLDLFVPRWRLRRLSTLLSDAGYQRMSTEPTATTWLGPPGTIAIDVHDSIKAVRSRHDEVWEVFSASRTSVLRAGIEIPVPGDPVRQLHVMVHLSQSGLDDVGALDDARAALVVSPIEEWAAAHELSSRLGCRAMFEAPLRVLDEACDVRHALGIADGDTLLLGESGPARNHALAMVSVSVQRDLGERMIQAARLARMHPQRMGAPSGRSSLAWCLHRFREASGSVQCVRDFHREILDREQTVG